MSDFLDNKYTRWYRAIVEHRRLRPLRKSKHQYTEVHHILPQSLGGDDTLANKVRLTGREHALCHWLLTKMTTGADYEKMVYAFNMMGVKGDHFDRRMTRMITRAYERNKEEWSRLMSEARKGTPAWNKGLKLDSEKYGKGGRKNKGRVKTPEEIEKRISKMRENGNDKRSNATKKLMSEQRKGVSKGPQSDEHRKAISNGVRGKKKKVGHSDNVAAAVLGNISINKDGKEKRVKQHQLQEFLDTGWSLGGRLRNKKQK
jgi:hypothetical protein